MEICSQYVGVTCVNGNCPNALAYDYSEYGYEPCKCEECWHYKGCEDCCWKGREECVKSVHRK